MIKAVIFDMGGVILDLDMGLCVRNFKEMAGFSDIEEYLDIYHQKGFISDFEEGLSSEEDFYQECLKHCPKGTSREVLEYSFQSLLTGVKPDVARQIRALSKDYDLYVLSNNNPLCTRRFLHLLEKEGIRDCFKDMFFSFRMKLLKPGEAIFRETLGQIGCKPQEALFIDDAADNVEGAKVAGLNAVLYRDGMEIRPEEFQD